MTVPPLELPDQIDRCFFEAESILGYIVTIAGELSVEIPETQYVTIGDAVHDCNQVVVSMSQLQTGLPNATSAGLTGFDNCPPTWSLTLVCDIVRCSPKMSRQTGTLSSEKQSNMARQASADAAVLFQAANRRFEVARWGTLQGTVQFLEPEGANYAVRMNLLVAVH